MPLLEDGRLVDDPWVAVGEEDALPDGPVLLSLARLQREAALLAGRNAPLGLALPPDVSPDVIAPWLPQLALVALRFPVFRDGRALTQARALREYHGFAGEIRATGHVIPDLYAMMLRCGFSSVELPGGADPAPWNAARHLIHTAYQRGLAGDAPLSLLRRRLEIA
jgi:uncharacterized protein (DUF934 family)